MTFHSGEIAIQNQAGVRDEAQRLCHLIGNIIKPAAQEFLKNQQLAVVSTVDINGRVWASLLTGEPGFITVLGEQIIQIDASLNSNSGTGEVGNLYHNLTGNNTIGLIIIDFANRRRLRLNGKASLQSDGKINVEIEQAFFNCPKYIQVRYVETEIAESFRQPEILIRDALSQTDQNWITQADTFFIASCHPEIGADVSHRGGSPGFVQVLNSKKLVFPDYQGNNMFQTFGNLLVNSHAGLLFINFENGHTLQFAGKASVIWNAMRVSEIPHALRLVEFDIEQVLESRNACSLRWRFGVLQ
jgi:uncharacterized protein